MSWNKIHISTPDKPEPVEAQAPVIISASRSTDIPAFYAEWFINRMKEGYVKWKNPFNGVPLYVSFEKARLIVFWTKNVKPMIKHLDYLDERAVNYYFQFTLNDYDAEKLEPHVPDVQTRIKTFQQLSERIGKEKVIWRFDPLILTDKTGVYELLRKVENVGNQLKNHTNKMVFSFADIKIYRKVQINLRNNAINYQEFNEQTMHEFALGLQQLNKKWNFEIGTCAEPIPLEKYGIIHNKCVDDDLMIKLFSNDKVLMDFLGVKIIHALFNPNSSIIEKTKKNKDKGQRQFCGCIVSKDIGEYNTCPHLCEYCYANTSKETVLANWQQCRNNKLTETITEKLQENNIESYIEQIKALAKPSFQQIRNIACSSISHFTREERDGFWERLNRGTNLLDSHELMCQYLWSYGNMHEAKIYKALEEALKSISDQRNVFNNDFSIIDWGCGQGLATVCFFDFLNKRSIANKVQEIILIEPSELVLERAQLHVNAYVRNEDKIKTVCKYLDDVTTADIEIEQPVTFHFFSNILDIPQIDLKNLAQLVGANVTGEHYFFCIGPLNYGNRRIDAFYDYFQTPLVLSDVEQGENILHENKLQMIAEDALQKDSQRNYTLKLKVFKFERNKIYYIPINYYPAVQFHAGYQLDCIKSSFKTLPLEQQNKIAALYRNVSDFEVSAPFDIGASIYDDVHPVFAVLNNIITRGLPTKASPFVEEVFNAFGNTKQKDNLGAIVFNKNHSDVNDLFLSLHLIDSRFKLTPNNYNCKKLDSDLERTYILEKTPVYLRQLLQPQRTLLSITNDNRHHSQRVDFACEFPYPHDNIKGCVIELDGQQYHTNPAIDQQRDNDIRNHGWNCIRISDAEINDINHHAINNEYIRNIEKAYTHDFDEKWTASLQMVLSPIAIARVQKTILEALMTGVLSIKKDEWKILVLERDVPCAAIAFEDLKQMFNHLIALSRNYSTMKFPEIKLEIISTQEFVNSKLHLNTKPVIQATHQQKNTKYDMVIDVSMLRRNDIENISFSEYKCHNNCYFNIRSAHYRRSDRYIYTSDTVEYKPLVRKDRQGNYKNLEKTVEHLKYFLQLLFRKEDFRPGQLPILSRALQNKSVIGLLPTGGGKSLTYQLAAMLQPGITIVIDPLRALMKDQYDGLINNGIDTCTFIYYTKKDTEEKDMIEKDKREREKREKQMESSQVQFVFLSPERLCIYRFRERLKRMRDLHVYFAYGVIDEVHCVSEWGHDFRFPYLHLGRNLYNYVCSKDQKKHLTLFGLTATASFDVLADVERELSGDGAFPLDADTIVRYENTNRLELQYKIEKVPVNAIMNRSEVYRAKQNFLREYINQIHIYINELQTKTSLDRIKTSFAERQDTDYELINTDLSTNVDENFYIPQETYSQAGIVFCPHRDNTGISVFNNEIALIPVIPQIGTFTGGGDSDFTSFNNLELFRDNKLPLMIATKAFGMGIDKPNVRFTVNMNYSDSLESFVQEAGRAGRDRKMALSIILFAEHEADNETVMYFHRNNFKGIEVEKQIMRWLLSKLSMPISHKNDVEFPQTEKVANFLNKLLSTHEGEVIVAFISYNTIIQLYKGIKINRILEQNITTQIFTVELENRTIVNVPEQDIIEIDKAGIDKAIYRMCCIGLIDDFTQDYAKKRFRIVTKRKADGEYYQGLKRFLMRYYSEEKAEQEIQKVPNYRGENEIHKCLGYLTEFIYEKIAVKRKRTIDDMHTFCIQGLDDTKDWKEVNEDLKDFIYFYFNSKYAKDDYETEKGEPFSLTSDTDRGKKSSFDILFKYLRVIDEDVYGSSGSPKDSIKHLQGAVRLIRRSLTDTNAALSMLNVFCLAYLGTNNNETLEEELENSYKEGYMSFFEDEEDKYSFYNNTKNLTEKFKSIPLSKKTLTDIQEWSLHCELNIHNNWLDNFKKSYIK